MELLHASRSDVEVLGRQDLSHVLALAQAAVSQQFQVSERLDAKARGQLTIAGSWFALVQAVAGVSVALGNFGAGWTAAILGLAVVGGTFLVATMHLSYEAWRLRPEEEIEPAELLTLKDFAFEPPGERDVDVELVLHYKDLLDDRMETNKQRAAAVTSSQLWWALATGTAFFELAVALIARVA